MVSASLARRAGFGHAWSVLGRVTLFRIRPQTLPGSQKRTFYPPPPPEPPTTLPRTGETPCTGGASRHLGNRAPNLPKPPQTLFLAPSFVFFKFVAQCFMTGASSPSSSGRLPQREREDCLRRRARDAKRQSPSSSVIHIRHPKMVSISSARLRPALLLIRRSPVR